MKLLITLSAAMLFILSAQAGDTGKHLFILSGQSNMWGMDPDISFTPAVKEAFGESSVIVVKNAEGGQPILRWYKEWKSATGESSKMSGGLYVRLMRQVKGAIKDQKIASVTFIWMQGETDARKSYGEVYEASLKGLLAHVKEDLDIDTLHFVIGRLSDCEEWSRKHKHWAMIRDIQVKLAEGDPNGAWVDTDDLNNKTRDGKPVDDLHYTPEGYKILGQRFAEKAIALIKEK